MRRGCEQEKKCAELSKRIAFYSLKLFADQNANGVVEVEQFNCCTANWTKADDARAFQLKMLLPKLVSRIEQWDNLAGNWIDR
jgi:hypothetical protein